MSCSKLRLSSAYLTGHRWLLAATPHRPVPPAISATASNITSMAKVQDVVRVLAHNPAHERVNDNSSNGSAKPVVAASMFEFSFSKLSRRLLGIAGVMACVVVLVTSSRWSEMHQPARLANGFTKGDSSPFGIRGGGDGGAAAESTLVHDEVKKRRT